MYHTEYARALHSEIPRTVHHTEYAGAIHSEIPRTVHHTEYDGALHIGTALLTAMRSLSDLCEILTHLLLQEKQMIWSLMLCLSRIFHRIHEHIPC